MKLVAAVPLLLAVLCVLVSGDYELQVEFHRFDNPNQRCAECHTSNGSTISFGCCDDLFTGDQCNSSQCDVYFILCQGRSLGTSNDSRECPVMIEREDRHVPNTDGVSFRGIVTGYPNPVTLTGQQWVGTQFYMEFMDDDAHSSTDQDDLIDMLAIDVDIPVGGSISRTTYTGRFNNAQVDLSFRVVCAENYYGPDCTRFCNDSSCPCEPGYTGEFCETELEDCVVGVCGNGTCIDDLNGYHCECNPGFTGTHCGTNIDDCVNITCNNGTCQDGVNSHTCVCNPGFSGADCQTNIDDCVGKDCSGKGWCKDGLDSYTCVCEPGFTGKDCDIDIKECEVMDIDCRGRGSCIDQVNDYRCECVRGYSGKNCERNIDDCLGVTCSNNGRCRDGVDSYSCSCNTGFTGEFCEVNIDDCEGVKCDKNKVCLDGMDSYTCICKPGYTGRRTCEAIRPLSGGNNNNKSDNSLGMIIGGAIGGVVVILIILIFVFLLIMVLLKRSIKRIRYNVEDTLKSQSVTPGDNPVYDADAEIDEEKSPDTMRELKNPIYDSNNNTTATEHGYEQTTLNTDEEERKFVNPIYGDLEEEEKILRELAESFDDVIYGKGFQPGSEQDTSVPKTASNGTATMVDGHTNNPIHGSEKREAVSSEEVVNSTNPLYRQSYEGNGTVGVSLEDSMSSSLVHSSIYDDDFMKAEGEGLKTGNELSATVAGAAKQTSSRRQDYEEVV